MTAAHSPPILHQSYVSRVRIVVGVSGSPSSMAALRWAVTEAHLHAAEIWAVHIWSAPTETFAPYALLRGVPSREQQKEASSALLAAAIRHALGSSECDVIVRPSLVEGSPITVLLGYAAHTHLLVLGRRVPTHRASSMTPGAVARACIASSRCPTVLVPEDHVVADATISSLPG